MKNRRRNIIISILLIPILSIILHGIIPHHHHDDLEHSGHAICEQSSQHSDEEHDGHQYTCNTHPSDDVETCEACHFSIEAVKGKTEIQVTGFVTDPNEAKLVASQKTVSEISIEQVYKESHFQYYLFRRGPPPIV